MSDEPYTMDIYELQNWCLLQAIKDYQTKPYSKLKHKNLREEFYNTGLIPQGYFSYTCGQTKFFDNPCILREFVGSSCDNGLLIELSTPHLIKEYEFKIDPKTTIYKIGYDFDHIYHCFSEDIKNGDMILPNTIKPIIDREKNRIASFEIDKAIKKIKLDLDDLNDEIDSSIRF